uniref:Uncharacterized protein n=1 Tax=Anopheles minimus TaxID=112268 RepID=A0A182W5U1_9DIPT
MQGPQPVFPVDEFIIITTGWERLRVYPSWVVERGPCVASSPNGDVINLLTNCDVNCHKKCEKLAANLCGVNQKLIVEALSSVRRGNPLDTTL